VYGPGLSIIPTPTTVLAYDVDLAIRPSPSVRIRSVARGSGAAKLDSDYVLVRIILPSFGSGSWTSTLRHPSITYGYSSQKEGVVTKSPGSLSSHLTRELFIYLHRQTKAHDCYSETPFVGSCLRRSHTDFVVSRGLAIIAHISVASVSLLWVSSSELWYIFSGHGRRLVFRRVHY
jgi:hypothetical protein